MIELIDKIKGRLTVDIREKTDPYLGKRRQRNLVTKNFTIFSNNCWGGHFYRYFNLPYLSPTIGMYFFAEDYMKFLSNIKKYIEEEIRFVTYKDSKYRNILEDRGGENLICPIGIINDIEIVFLHYKTKEEALSKWRRRTERICWDNIIVKMSEMNLCTDEIVMGFDKLSFDRKFIFTTIME
jgi:uncharacterized protein (DUF1919 family)